MLHSSGGCRSWFAFIKCHNNCLHIVHISFVQYQLCLVLQYGASLHFGGLHVNDNRYEANIQSLLPQRLSLFLMSIRTQVQSGVRLRTRVWRKGCVHCFLVRDYHEWRHPTSVCISQVIRERKMSLQKLLRKESDGRPSAGGDSDHGAGDLQRATSIRLKNDKFLDFLDMLLLTRVGLWNRCIFWMCVAELRTMLVLKV